MSDGDYLEVDTDVLRDAGHKLSDLSSALKSVEAKVQLLSGEDDIHGHKMVDAVQHTFEAWQNDRRTYITNVDNYGDLAVRIADETEELDGDISQAIEEVDFYFPRYGGGGM